MRVVRRSSTGEGASVDVSDELEGRPPGHDSATLPADVDARLEINALCLTSPRGHLLVLMPADEKVDTRWLALLLGVPRRKVRLASLDECGDLFGAVAGLVPPLPLRPNVTVLCHPRLRDARGGLWASAGDVAYTLIIDEPERSLPALAGAYGADGSAAPTLECSAVLSNGEEALGCAFAWLPSPSLWHASLEQALETIHAMRIGGPVFASSRDGPVFSFRSAGTAAQAAHGGGREDSACSAAAST